LSDGGSSQFLRHRRCHHYGLDEDHDNEGVLLGEEEDEDQLLLLDVVVPPASGKTAATTFVAS
jgi:hypothetical protein